MKLKKIFKEGTLKANEPGKDWIKRTFNPEEINFMKRWFVDNEPLDFWRNHNPADDKIGEKVYEKWYAEYMDHMPTGIAKARTGDPDEFILNQIENVWVDSIENAARETGLMKEKAVSKKQQKFMGMVRGIQKGEVSPKSVGPKVKKAAKSMKAGDVKDFASTKHKGLPTKITETSGLGFDKIQDIFIDTWAEMDAGKNLGISDDELGDLIKDFYSNHYDGSENKDWIETQVIKYVYKQAPKMYSETLMEQYISDIVKETIVEYRSKK